ncbi:helix-turn-helix transcriptional regulator [Halococcus sp. IIIV-5B]|uniref:helix-turn-helix transcriptional regulator n=1 Tax=Halococcus sp. IIIV-5B TaxID=2321230 RepID=UPI0018F338E7|nr:helix-turn-helix transcriptional regulator [Halococcus sp. IIIV-5B]
MQNDLKVRRAEDDLTQKDLAEAVDVSRQTIGAIEGGRSSPSLAPAFFSQSILVILLKISIRQQPERSNWQILPLL